MVGPLNNMGLNCTSLLIHRFFSVNIVENLGEICNNLKKLANETCSLEISKKLRKRHVMNH